MLFAALSSTHHGEEEQLQLRQLHKLLLAGLVQAVPVSSGGAGHWELGRAVVCYPLAVSGLFILIKDHAEGWNKQGRVPNPSLLLQSSPLPMCSSSGLPIRGTSC